MEYAEILNKNREAEEKEKKSILCILIPKSVFHIQKFIKKILKILYKLTLYRTSYLDNRFLL